MGDEYTISFCWKLYKSKSEINQWQWCWIPEYSGLNTNFIYVKKVSNMNDRLAKEDDFAIMMLYKNIWPTFTHKFSNGVIDLSSPEWLLAGPFQLC